MKMPEEQIVTGILLPFVSEALQIGL